MANNSGVAFSLLFSIAVEEEVNRVIIYVDSDSDVTDSEDSDTASVDNKSMDTADESKLFVQFENLKSY